MSFTKTALATIALMPLSLSMMTTPAVAASPQPVPSSFTFKGAGWGHGVGMSQYGAYGMALSGYTSKQILEHYYNPAQLTNTTEYASKDIRVQILTGVSTSKITPTDGKLRVKFDKRTIESSKPVTFAVSGKKTKITVEGKSYTVPASSKVTLEWQKTRSWAGDSKNTIVNVPLANEGHSSVNYRHGKMEIVQRSGKLNLVNVLRLNDEYLYGLGEMPSSWAPAALQSQAIAGRTYAMSNLKYKVSCDCNVYDEVKSQKFVGWNKENEARGVIGKRWVNAVNATQKKKNGVPTSAQVVKYKGKLISAVYSSTTGGKTRTAKSIWGSDHAYLQSRDDHWALDPRVKNPNASWSYTASQSKLSKGYGLPNVKSISFVKNRDNTIASSTATSTTGAKRTLTGVQTRSVFGTKSSWVFSITPSKATTGGVQVKPKPKPPVAPVKAGTKKVTTTALNMRVGASVGQKRLSVIPQGKSVTLTGKKSGAWVQVKYETKTGWVSAKYLK